MILYSLSVGFTSPDSGLFAASSSHGLNVLFSASSSVNPTAVFGSFATSSLTKPSLLSRTRLFVSLNCEAFNISVFSNVFTVPSSFLKLSFNVIGIVVISAFDNLITIFPLESVVVI